MNRCYEPVLIEVLKLILLSTSGLPCLYPLVALYNMVSFGSVSCILFTCFQCDTMKFSCTVSNVNVELVPHILETGSLSLHHQGLI